MLGGMIATASPRAPCCYALPVPTPGAPILVTGFEPFDERGYNTSSMVLELLPRAFAGRPVEVRTLPVAWGTAGTELEAALDELRPGLVICLGLVQAGAPSERGLRLAQPPVARGQASVGLIVVAVVALLLRVVDLAVAAGFEGTAAKSGRLQLVAAEVGGARR